MAAEAPGGAPRPTAADLDYWIRQIEQRNEREPWSWLVWLRGPADYQLFEEVRNLLTRCRSAVEQRERASREPPSSPGPTPSAVEPVSPPRIHPAVDLLDQLTRAANSADRARPEVAAALDRVLAGLGAWLAVDGLIVWPRGWHWASGTTAPAFDARWLDRRACFDHAPVGSLLHVEVFGLAQGEQAIRKGVVVVSGGPGPEGWDRLAHLVAGQADAPSAAVRQALERWLQASLDGPDEFRRAALTFFKGLFGSDGLGLRQAERERFREIVKALEAVLQAAFGYRCFRPRALREYDDRPGWVEVRPRGDRTSEAVRVIRPGLVTLDDQLVESALVE